MKKIVSVFAALAMTILVFIAAGGAQATQNAWSYVAKAYTGGSATLLNTDAQGALLTSQGASKAVNLTTGTVVKLGAGRVASVSVNVAGAAGAIYDVATVASAAAANQIAVVPATVGVYRIDFPITTGLVYVPGVSQVAAISYN